MQFTDTHTLSDAELAGLIGQTNFAVVEAIIAESGAVAPKGNGQVAQSIADTTPADGGQQAATTVS